jgi:hypothetical protein
LGTMHALALRDVLRSAAPDQPAGLVRAFDEATTAIVEPWYRNTVAFDRHRLGDIEARIKGETYAPDDPAYELGQALSFAANLDPDCLRAFLSVVGVLATPEEAIARPGVFDKVVELGAGWRDAPTFGPTRQELLSIVSS